MKNAKYIVLKKANGSGRIFTQEFSSDKDLLRNLEVTFRHAATSLENRVTVLGITNLEAK